MTFLKKIPRVLYHERKNPRQEFPRSQKSTCATRDFFHECHVTQGFFFLCVKGYNLFAVHAIVTYATKKLTLRGISAPCGALRWGDT